MTQESPITSPEADPHLSAEGLSDQLKHRSARGGALMVASFALQLLIGVGGTAILARLLTPVDFGYFAMVGSVLGFVVALRDFLAAPAIHREDLTHAQASGLFWMNCLASLLVAGAFAAMAPVLSWFYAEPKVSAVTLIMSVGILISMSGMVHGSLLRRQMRYGAISLIEIGATVAGVVVGVIAARMGADYWALVYQQMVVWVWQTVAAWVLCTWRPASPGASAFHRDEGVRSMLQYGQSATASRVLSYASRNIDAVLVGRFVGAHDLGLYQKAYQWAMTPFWQIFIPMFPVAVSSLSRLQDDPPRFRIYARTIMQGLFAMTLPGTALLMIEADHVIRLLMGEQWLHAIPILRILCVGAFCSAFTMVTGWLYLSEGRTGEQLTWSLVSAPITILGVAIGLNWGAIGVARGFTIAILLLIAPGIWLCLRRSRMNLGDFVQASWRPVVASILAGIGLWAIRWTLQPSWHFALALVVHTLIYGLLYVICWLALPGGLASWRSFLGHVREIRQGVPA